MVRRLAEAIASDLKRLAEALVDDDQIDPDVQAVVDGLDAVINGDRGAIPIVDMITDYEGHALVIAMLGDPSDFGNINGNAIDSMARPHGYIFDSYDAFQNVKGYEEHGVGYVFLFDRLPKGSLSENVDDWHVVKVTNGNPKTYEVVSAWLSQSMAHSAAKQKNIELGDSPAAFYYVEMTTSAVARLGVKIPRHPRSGE